MNGIKRNINIYWVLSLIYMGFIFYLSSYPITIKVQTFSYFDKLAHIAAYGVLASLIYVALRETEVIKDHLLKLAFAIAFLYGVTDEIHQYFVPGRHADILDVVADGIGALCFPLALQYRNKEGRKGLRTKKGSFFDIIRYCI